MGLWQSTSVTSCSECQGQLNWANRGKTCVQCLKEFCGQCRAPHTSVPLCLACADRWAGAFPAGKKINRPVLVLDLDETIVHTSFKPMDTCDFEVPVKDLSLQVAVRPGVAYFLEELSTVADVIIWTASPRISAEPVLDMIDTKGHLYGRLYRDSCTNEGFVRIKDLSKLHRPISRIVILDDNPACYRLHAMNGLSLSQWRGDMDDTELTNLVPRLKALFSQSGSLMGELDRIRNDLAEQHAAAGRIASRLEAASCQDDSREAREGADAI